MRPIRSMLAAAVWIALSSVAEASSPQIPMECAARDLKFLWQIDEYGERSDVPGEKLYAAFLTMLRARSVCAAGQAAEAMALYDSAFGPFVAASSNSLRPSRQRSNAKRRFRVSCRSGTLEKADASRNA